MTSFAYRVKSCVTACCAALTVACLYNPGSAVAQQDSPDSPLEFWVRTDGDPEATYANCTPTHAFASIDQARLQIRAWRAVADRNPRPIIVNVGGGEYQVSVPIVFDANDSGWDQYPIRYVAWDPDGSGPLDADPLMSGGTALTAWQAATTPYGVSAYWCPVPSDVPDVRDLWVNNRRMVRARYPNTPTTSCTPEEYPNPITAPPQCENDGFLVVSAVERFQDPINGDTHRVTVRRPRTIAPVTPTFPSISSWTGVEAVAHNLYVSPRQIVDAGLVVNENDLRLDFWVDSHPNPLNTMQDFGGFGTLGTFTHISVQSAPQTGNPVATQVYLENHLGFLNANFEWYFDPTPGDRRVWLKLCDNPTTLNARVVIPKAQQLLVLSTAANLRFEGIDWAYTRMPFPKQADNSTPGYTTVQAGLQWVNGSGTTGWYNTLPAAIRMEGATNCVLHRCRIGHTSGSGVEIASYTGAIDPPLSIESHYNALDGCEIFDVGGHGVFLGDHLTGADDWSTSFDPYKAEPHEFNQVTRCNIWQFGVVYKDAVGIWVSHTRDTLIANNEVSYGNWSGVSIGNLNKHEWVGPTCGGGFANWRRNTENTRVEHNYIHDVMLRLIDGGAIYSTGAQVASSDGAATVHGNYIQKVILNPYLNFRSENIVGTYFDQGSDGWRITGNFVQKVSHLFKFSSGTDPMATQPINQGFGGGAWAVPWEQECGGDIYPWPGHEWDDSNRNLWFKYTTTTGAYALFGACYGNVPLATGGAVAAANGQVEEVTLEAQSVINAAGPLVPWFPGAGERIYKTPLCGQSDDPGEQMR